MLRRVLSIPALTALGLLVAVGCAQDKLRVQHPVLVEKPKPAAAADGLQTPPSVPAENPTDVALQAVRTPGMPLVPPHMTAAGQDAEVRPVSAEVIVEDPPALAKPPAPNLQLPGARIEGKGNPESIPPPPDPQRLPAPSTLPGVAAPAPELAGLADAQKGNITLHVDNVGVHKALEILSRQGNVNIMVSPNVTGQVTLNLSDVSLTEALQAILSACRLTARRDKDIIFVYTAAEEALREEQDMPVRVYRLSYARSEDVLKMIKPLISRRGTATANPKSEVGIKSDPEAAGGDSMAGGEILIVQDYDRVLRTLDRVVAQIDAPPLQVLIEAVIVSVRLDKSCALGVNFALIDTAQNTLGVAGSGAALNAATGFTPAQMLTAGGKLAGPSTGGFTEAAHGLKFGFVDNSVTGFIRALETVGEVKILASPRILVLNKQRAEVQLGERLGYKTLSQSQVSTTEQINFMQVGTQLRLRPFITNDGIIRMEVHPEKSTGEIVDGIPQSNTSEVTTNVMVPDAATIVIGGLIEDEEQYHMSGIPGLCKLPIVGVLFSTRERINIRKELICILTPRIWRPQGCGLPPGREPPPGTMPPPGIDLRPSCSALPASGCAGHKDKSPGICE